MSKGKAICLSRVSTGIQDLDQQTERLIEAARLNGYNKSDLIIIEDKESAVKLSEEERNGLTRMKTAIKENKVDIVICYELSRISRRPDVVYSIRDFLIQNKVQLQVLNPSFKLLKDDGSFDENSNILFSLFSGLAESEGYLRKARLARGKIKSAKENKYLGGPVPFGYKLDNENHYIIDEEKAAYVRKIFEDYKTKTIGDIARSLMLEGVHTGKLVAARSFVFQILHRIQYTGQASDKKKFDIRYPAIISKATFDEAQKKLELRKTSPRINTKREYLAKGLLFDNNDCHYYAGNNFYYTKKFLHTTEQVTCISVKEIEKITWFMAKHFYKFRPQKSIEEQQEEIQAKFDLTVLKLNNAYKKLEEYKAQMLRIEDRLIRGKITEEQADYLEENIEFEMKSINQEKNNLEADRDSLKQRLNNLSSDLVILNSDDLDKLPFEEKRKLVNEQIARIIINKNAKNDYDFTFFYNICDDGLILKFNPYKKLLTRGDEVINYN